jgi:hypothetical protein
MEARREFVRLEPTKVAVVIGYEISAGKSLNPAISSLAGLAVLAASPVGVLLGGVTDFAIDTVTAPEVGNITMVDDFNTAVFASIREKLQDKGYDVKLIKTAPIEFEWRDDEGGAEAYYAYGVRNYQLGEAELSAIDADIVLYLEYSLAAYVESLDQLQSMDAVDLRIDTLARSARAYTPPPANTLVYDGGKVWEEAGLYRFEFERAVDRVTSERSWPSKAAIAAQKAKQ